ncbi:hypothetical protein HK405_002207 [Cladochytrium tenue]|nr:hypothetical protein HK405_002207 [Cladochytrium tenue]
MTLDLMSLASVDAFASAFLARGLPLHGLVLNAGIMATPFALSADGIESQFATNHVAHFHLTQRLLDRIVESAPSRIVVVSSDLHSSAPKPEGIRFDKISDQATYKPFAAYYRGQYFVPIAKLGEPNSKLASDAALAKKLWEFTDKLVQEKRGK